MDAEPIVEESGEGPSICTATPLYHEIVTPPMDTDFDSDIGSSLNLSRLSFQGHSSGLGPSLQTSGFGSTDNSCGFRVPSQTTDGLVPSLPTSDLGSSNYVTRQNSVMPGAWGVRATFNIYLRIQEAMS